MIDIIILEEEPEVLKNGKIIAEDWRFINPNQCRRCKRKYDTNHTERKETLLHADCFCIVKKVYSAKTGFCPECTKNAQNNMTSCNRYWKNNRKVMRGALTTYYEDGLELPTEIADRMIGRYLERDELEVHPA